MQVTSSTGTVDQSDLVDPSPKVDTWDPSETREGTGSGLEQEEKVWTAQWAQSETRYHLQ